MMTDDKDIPKPCPKCRGTRKVVATGIKNGRYYRKVRACRECSPIKDSLPPEAR